MSTEAASSAVSMLLFDLGGVVARFVPDRRLAELVRLGAASAERPPTENWASGLSRDFDLGHYKPTSKSYS